MTGCNSRRQIQSFACLGAARCIPINVDGRASRHVRAVVVLLGSSAAFLVASAERTGKVSRA